jgi:hypothetical protein
MSVLQTVTANAVLGPGLTGLAIGLRVLNTDRSLYSAFSTTDVVETTTPGTYSKTSGVVTPAAGGYIVWGVAGTDYAEVAVDSSLLTRTSALQTVTANAVLGPALTGLAIGLRVLNLDRSLFLAFSTTDVVETTTPGTYSKTSGVIAPAVGGYIVWGVAGTDYAEVAVDNNLLLSTSSTGVAVAGHETLVAGATFMPATQTGLAISPLWEKAYYTVKRRKKTTGNLAIDDGTALLQVRVSNPVAAGDGLRYLNAASATDAAWGILVLDVATGQVTRFVAAGATVLLAECAALDWDIKTVNSDDSVDVLVGGTAEVVLTPTKTI